MPVVTGCASRRALLGCRAHGVMRREERAMAERAQYVDSRRFGAATVTVISEGRLPVPIASSYPAPEAEWLRAHGEADPDDRLVSDQAGILLRHGGAPGVVD